MNEKEKWFRALSDVDPTYVEEAEPYTARNIRKTRRKKLVAVAILALMVTVSVWLFVPYDTSPPSVDSYKDSDYFDVISYVNLITHQKPKFKNNYEMLLDSLMSMIRSFGSNYGGNDGDQSNESGGNAESGSNGSYAEITDNQEMGVVEGDLIKRTDKYIFYLDTLAEMISIFSIDGEDSETVATFRLNENRYENISISAFEIFLSSDGNTLTLISHVNVYHAHYDYVPLRNGVLIENVDVSDLQDIHYTDYTIIEGRYKSSRLVENNLLVVTESVKYKNKIDYNDPQTFIPVIDYGEGYECIANECVMIPKESRSVGSPFYTIAAMLDSKTLAPIDQAALIGFSGEVYVSNSSICVNTVIKSENTNVPDKLVSDGTVDSDTAYRNSYTELTLLDYSSGGFADPVYFTVMGTVKDRYSIDQYDNTLRVVTNTCGYVYQYSSQNPSRYTSASLFILDVTDGSFISSVINFAPKGDTVRSVRFEDTKAYVCTAIRVTDPVYFFDLTDPGNVTYTDTGEIPGFSTSLTDIGGGYLLGIGVDSSWASVKFEIYTKSGETVVPVCEYVVPEAFYSEDYHTVFIDRANLLFGMPIYSISEQNGESIMYVLLKFNGESLGLVASVNYTAEVYNRYYDVILDDVRGVVIDGYLYVIIPETEIQVQKLNVE